MFDTVISGGILISAHDRYRGIRGSIGITDGRISYAGERILSSSDARSFIDATGCIVMPGLVNGHVHGDMQFAKGAADLTTLGEQMELFRDNNWFFGELSLEDRFYSRKHLYCEAVLAGTTFLVENMYWALTDELSVKAFTDIGLNGAPVQDVRYDFYRSDGFLTDEMLQAFKTTCEKAGLTPLLGTLPEEEFTKDRLGKVREILDKGGMRCTSHLAETTWRHESAVRNMGKSPVKVLDEAGLLNERYIASHAVYLDDEDIAVMAQRGAKVVSTPLCELKIADGRAPIRDMVNTGVTVALGTDGAMWNNSNDLFREMKGMSLIHNLDHGAAAFRPEEILDMATVNGAKLFGLEKEFGTLEEGKRADVIVIDAERPHMRPLRTGRTGNVASTVVYCATGQDVRDVFIGGRDIVRGHQLLTDDVRSIIQRTQEIAERVISEDSY